LMFVVTGCAGVQSGDSGNSGLTKEKLKEMGINTNSGYE